jgi:two-component system sensor histidine kinase YesM
MFPGKGANHGKGNILKTVEYMKVRTRSIQFIITVSITVIALFIMLFVGLSLYKRFTKAAHQNAVINARQTIDQICVSLEYYLRGMMEISDSINNLIYYSDDIDAEDLAEKINLIVNSRKDIVSVSVFSTDGDIVTSTPYNKLKSRSNIVQQDWFRDAIESPSNLFFSSPHVQNIFESQHSWVTSLSREITYKKGGTTHRGVLLVDMNITALDQLCRGASLGKKGYVYLVDANGDIVYHPQQPLINVGLKSEKTAEVQAHGFGKYFEFVDGKERLVTIETVYYCRWRLVGIMYMDDVVNTYKEINVYVIWVLLSGILFAIFISAFISAKISQPIKKLEKSMKKVEEGQLDICIDVRGEAEVAQLSKTFNLMVARMRQLMDQIVLEQEAKRKSELNALQAQINPHFLYNTLDSIVWMAENERTQDVITMVTALARLFRISISRGMNVISVREEIEHARNYLVIQQIRYRNKFRFEIEAQDDALRYKTLKLILQPIVENAIYHGVRDMADEGLIRISAEVIGEKLLLQVSDNGLGMNPEVLKNILVLETSGKKGSGVGVKNVHQRIQLYYGMEYGLEIESVQEAGTDVKIWLPLLES